MGKIISYAGQANRSLANVVEQPPILKSGQKPLKWWADGGLVYCIDPNRPDRKPSYSQPLDALRRVVAGIKLFLADMHNSPGDYVVDKAVLATFFNEFKYKVFDVALLRDEQGGNVIQKTAEEFARSKRETMRQQEIDAAKYADRDKEVSVERNQIKEFAEAIHKGEAGVTHDNAKTVLQHAAKILGNINLSMVNVLPLMFNLNQQPYTLDRHFFFEPMFSTQIATNSIVISARQIGKSMTIASSSVALGTLIPHMRLLTVTPLFEQVRRLSQNYVKPFIQESPIRDLIVSPRCTDSVLQRDLANRSILYFSYAFTSVTRCRGISTYAIQYDELGDFDPEYIPIINQCASSAPDHLKFFRRFGTPKTMDNPMEQYWSQSSQAEWCIRCKHCGHWNIPSLDQDLDAMIGPKKPAWKVCQETPGIVCAGKSRADGKRCGKPLDTRQGRWIHAHEQKRWHNAGYHIPQIILPQHCESSAAWNLLLAAREGADNTTPAKFYNEICGVSYDGSSRLITLTDLKQACFLPTDIHKIQEAADFVKARLKDGIYVDVVMGVDWGGGGAKELSFTTIAIAALRYDGKIDIPFGYRSLTPHNHEKETAVIITMKKMFQCSKIVHDANNAGRERETILTMSGLHEGMFCRMYYHRLGRGAIVKWTPGNINLQEKPGYILDKTRCVLWLISFIKNGYVRFFKYDSVSGGKLSLIDDFLSLVEDKHSTFTSDVYTIIRSAQSQQPDDFVHSCCYAVHYFYAHQMKGKYPKIQYLANSNVTELTNELVAQIEGEPLVDEV